MKRAANKMGCELAQQQQQQEQQEKEQQKSKQKSSLYIEIMKKEWATLRQKFN